MNSQYNSILGCHATTIHPWQNREQKIRHRRHETQEGIGDIVLFTPSDSISSGMRDGRHTNKDVCDMIMNDISHSDCKARIRQTQVLIIEEISMISARTLEQLDCICRHLRRLENILIGGLQVVLVGDFRQLKPVPNVLSLDAGEYCFTSKTPISHRRHHQRHTNILKQPPQTNTRDSKATVLTWHKVRYSLQKHGQVECNAG